MFDSVVVFMAALFVVKILSICWINIVGYLDALRTQMYFLYRVIVFSSITRNICLI